jgi:acetylornithine deacetylase
MTATAAEHLARLVSFDSISDRSNRALIQYAVEVLRGHDIEAIVIPDADGGKAGLHTTIGPDGPGGVVLSGHTDVVPVEGQRWSADPFTLVERDGRLYGRGAADMKGFIACCLAAVPAMAAAPLTRPIHLLMSYDEETTCRGVLPTLHDLVSRHPRIGAVIVGEPTGMEMVNAHKGAFGYDVRVIGRPAHSSLAHQGISANIIAARLTVWIDDRVRQGRAAARGGDGFTPPYSTCHVGRVRGGTACNILAGECVFDWDLRTVPSDDPQTFLEAFEAEAARLTEEARAKGHDIAVEIHEAFAVPGLRPAPDCAAEALCRQLTGQNGGSVVSYSSEAGFFQEAGLPTVLLGPGSIEQAHIADEFIERSQLNRCEDFLTRLIEAQST